MLVARAGFSGATNDRVTVETLQDGSYHTVEYRRVSSSTWAAASINDIEAAKQLELTIEQGLNRPPVLVARTQNISRVVWDPNPELTSLELGDARIFTWKDDQGRQWRGGLYQPVPYKSGQRYPLVIQTHGFREAEFRPSGFFTTAFAARALAANGIMVLQVREQCPLDTTAEGSCAASGYASAVRQLVDEGSVDPERVGIVGFSRTAFWALEALITSPSLFRAALIHDGLTASYSQYLQSLSASNNVAHQFDLMIGAPPFGPGLESWIQHSPTFNLDKIRAAVLLECESRRGVLSMWEPYAGLQYLHKPSELIMLNTDEHVLTNPAMRLASQGTSVDWFRFWLKGEEDAAPAKAEQYKRWRLLRKLQDSRSGGESK